MKWSEADRGQMAAQGVTLDEVERQLELLRHPPRPLDLLRPCAIGDGIRVLDDRERAAAAATAAGAAGRFAKFVPASGAASRMFQSLLAARAAGAAANRAEAEKRAAAGDDDAKSVLELLAGLPRFAFLDALRSAMAPDDPLDLARRGEIEPILDALLTPKGLDSANLPKGLLAFHRYPEGPRTAFEEHLVEGAGYAAGQGACRLYFTVSPEHLDRFQTLFEGVRRGYEERFARRFEVDFSVQKPSTDTIGGDARGEPFRTADGPLLFRPGGHGALIENLNDLRGDVVFVKNVDNVVPEHLLPLTIAWKHGLAGILLRLQAESFRHLDLLEHDPSTANVAAAESFARGELWLDVSAVGDLAARRGHLLRKLDRPMRVCGVVRNTGEPGGGPFWVRGADGSASVQIVESAQVDPDSADQRRIFAASTHFNPVDLVCGLRDRHGRCFDLLQYVEPTAIFLSRKSSGGRELIALERPGLWNGAMADWNTVFVEVPLLTFNPVKTVLDLLRPEHQNAKLGTGNG